MIHGDQRDKENDHILFALVGSYRTVRHVPYSKEETCSDGRKLTREALLGGLGSFLIQYPPNHVAIEKTPMKTILNQRFKVIKVSDFKSTIHIIPLTNSSGEPLRAIFHPDGKMDPSIPSMITKQLFFLNTSVFI